MSGTKYILGLKIYFFRKIKNNIAANIAAKAATLMMRDYATRRRGILSLIETVKVFDMWCNAVHNSDLRNMIGALPVMNTKKIATNIIKKRLDGSAMSDLVVRFNEHGGSLIFDVSIAIPDNWTPKLFLGAVDHSISINNVVVIKKIDDTGPTTLNKLF